jgi:hypothetical protein
MRIANIDPTKNYLIANTSIVLSGSTVLKLVKLLDKRPDILELLLLSIQLTDKAVNETEILQLNCYTQ